MSNYHVRAMKIAPPEWLSLNAVQSYRLGQNAAAEIAAQADAEIADLSAELESALKRVAELESANCQLRGQIDAEWVAAETAAKADARIAELECENKQLEARLDDLRKMVVSRNSETAWEVQESKRLSAELESARAGESAALERVAEMAGLLAAACCPNCDGSGAFLARNQELVTREMAIDAEDESLEGATYRDAEIEPCQWCYEKENVLAQVRKN